MVDIDEVMLEEKVMPREYINEEGNGVTQAYLDWLKPLVGELTPMITLNTDHSKEGSNT